MGKKLTSGPFFVPLYLNGTYEEVNYLLIGLNNISNRESNVHVTVSVCRETLLLYPPYTPSEATIYHKKVKMPGGTCAVIRLNAGEQTFQGNNLLRVTIEGDIYEDGKGVVVSLSGGADRHTAMTMVFKHENFIELK